MTLPEMVSPCLKARAIRVRAHSLSDARARSYGDTPSYLDPIDRDSLYAEFAPLIRRLLRQYGEDPEVRKDLIGEIYCRFCALLELYDPRRGVPLRPYLVRQLSASVYTFARHHWRVRRRETGLEIGEGQEARVRGEDPTAQWNQALIQEEIASTLPAAIAALPTRQRQVVLWRYYDAYSFEQIAAMLEIQPATVRSLLRHGLNNLRQRLGQSDCVAA